MIDVKKPENLSPQDLEKTTGGAGSSCEPIYYTHFKCPVACCEKGIVWKGDYSNKTNYNPPKCPSDGVDMVIAYVEEYNG
ncbi:MAG: hypothetical protein MJ189_05320 [Coriobacteriales bacterium]|nr:hypothetical protein [Coriobacteriales bacterium]